ncbi:DUF1513 domain-containing protein, partial [bacterium]|nr:DUF1513 domain-containing protein [bacterium]
WSGLVHHPKKPWLFAAHRGTQPTPGHIVVFHAETGERLAEYKTGINPYTVVLDASGDTLFVSNWGDRSVTAIDTRDGRVLATVPVGYNPCDLALAPDHLSVYALTLSLGPDEAGDDRLATPAGAVAWRERAAAAQDEERGALELEHLNSRLPAAGYNWYEISKRCRRWPWCARL